MKVSVQIENVLFAGDFLKITHQTPPNDSLSLFSRMVSVVDFPDLNISVVASFCLCDVRTEVQTRTDTIHVWI